MVKYNLIICWSNQESFATFKTFQKSEDSLHLPYFYTFLRCKKLEGYLLLLKYFHCVKVSKKILNLLKV